MENTIESYTNDVKLPKFESVTKCTIETTKKEENKLSERLISPSSNFGIRIEKILDQEDPEAFSENSILK
jgi:hypothetical protein